jgi:hypothetical protein
MQESGFTRSPSPLAGWVIFVCALNRKNVNGARVLEHPSKPISNNSNLPLRKIQIWQSAIQSIAASGPSRVTSGPFAQMGVRAQPLQLSKSVSLELNSRLSEFLEIELGHLGEHCRLIFMNCEDC